MVVWDRPQMLVRLGSRAELRAHDRFVLCLVLTLCGELLLALTGPLDHLQRGIFLDLWRRDLFIREPQSRNRALMTLQALCNFAARLP